MTTRELETLCERAKLIADELEREGMPTYSVDLRKSVSSGMASQEIIKDLGEQFETMIEAKIPVSKELLDQIKDLRKRITRFNQ